MKQSQSPQQNWKFLALALGVAGLLLLLWGATAVVRAGSQEVLPVVTIFDEKPRFELARALRAGAPTSTLTTTLTSTQPDLATLTRTFPYRAYLDSADLRDGRTVRDDLQTLDSLCPAGGRGTERLLYGVVTDSLAVHLERRFSPDSLAYVQAILQWADQFAVLAQLDPAHATLYRGIHLFWLNRATGHLAAAYARDENVKYSFAFKHLNQLCRQARGGVPVSFNASEKIVNNVAQGRWGYLCQKFWHDSPMATKIAIFGGGLFVLLPYGLLLTGRRFRRAA